MIRPKFKIGDVVRMATDPYPERHPSQSMARYVGELFIIHEVSASYNDCNTWTQMPVSFSYSVVPLQECTQVAWFEESVFELALDVAAYLNIPPKEWKLQREEIEEHLAKNRSVIEQ